VTLWPKGDMDHQSPWWGMMGLHFCLNYVPDDGHTQSVNPGMVVGSWDEVNVTWRHSRRVVFHVCRRERNETSHCSRRKVIPNFVSLSQSSSHGK